MAQTDAEFGTEFVSPSARRLRWLFRALVAVTVSPIVVAAVRNGSTGWEPTVDAATTAVRVRDVFSVHFPLIGMAALPSRTADSMFSFPGALELYALAVPVKLFGLVWGLQLGMAAINSAAAVAALWLMRRRLGEKAAIVAAMFLASLLWTAGSEILVDPMPIHMGIVPVFTLLIAVWAVADGDAPALVVLAVVANYLFLGQLKFVAVVPLLVVFALVAWAVRNRNDRRNDAARWRTRWRGERRWRLGAVIITVLAWLPPLIDQFFVSGNLGKILGAGLSGKVDGLQASAAAPTVTGALGVMTSVTAVPPSWLPPNFVDPPFDALGGGTPFVVGLLGALTLFGLLGWVAVRAARVGDRSVLTAVATGVVAWGAYLVTALRNPHSAGFVAKYFYGVWSLAAFLWMIVVLGVIRTVPGLLGWIRPRSRGPLAALSVMVLVFAALAWPVADHRQVQLAPLNDVSHDVRTTVGRHFRDHGPVLVETDSLTRFFRPSVLLGLQDAGTEFRVEGAYAVQQFGRRRSQAIHQDAVAHLVLTVSEHPTEPGTRLIETFPLRSRVLAPERFAEDTEKVRSWVESIDSLKLDLGPAEASPIAAFWKVAIAQLSKTALGDGTLIENPEFLAVFTIAQPMFHRTLLHVPDMSLRELERWANDMLAIHTKMHLYEVPL